MDSIISKVQTLYSRVGDAYTDGCRKTVVALATGVVIGNTHASTGISLGDVGNNAGSNAQGLTNGALLLSGFIGLTMVCVAFVKGRYAASALWVLSMNIYLWLFPFVPNLLPAWAWWGVAAITLASISTVSSVGNSISRTAIAGQE